MNIVRYAQNKKENKGSYWSWVLFSPVLFYILSLTCLHASTINKIMAKVNDDVILQADFDEVITPMIEQIKSKYGEELKKEELDKKIAEIKKEFLDQMIDQKLLLQEAKKKDIKVSKRDLENGIELIKDRFKKKGDKVLTPVEVEVEFNAEMKRQNLTMAQFRDKVREDLMINKLLDIEVVSKATKPTGEDLKTYFEKNKDKFDEPEKVSVRHILIRCEKNASIKDESLALNKIKEVQQKLKKGEDFAKLASEYSEDPGSAKDGGNLGFIVKGMMVKTFEDVAFKTPVGDISDYFKTEFGYHILKIDSKQAKLSRTFEQVKDNLEKYLMGEQNQEQYEKYMKDLRSKSTISITEK
ncbi:MAG: peptidylprolyl isomerase [Elusimicrobia bacterium]|nr:peptidylprolyl isomerase [Elusimicrobiota bacterium]